MRTSLALRDLLPEWQCHKRVRACQIVSVDRRNAVLHLAAGDSYITHNVTLGWLDRHIPLPGGYYVQYDDGYASYSPQEAFEAGYTQLAPAGR